jgi:hypothetical protein
MIVLDGSASIVASDWQKGLDFTNKVIDGFNMSADQVEVGVVQFASISELVIGLTPDKAAVQSAVTNLRQMKQNTNTYAGFKTAQDEIHAHGRTGTNGTLVILLTDGKQNQGLPASVIANDLKTTDKATIFGIGVGPDVDEPELQSWCSLPLSSHYFKVDDWSALQKVLNQILADACPPPAPPPPALTMANPGDFCKFHLPSPLPVTRRAPRIAPAPVKKEILAVEIEPMVAVRKAARKLQAPLDPCNQFDTCLDCIAAHTSGGETCGWCTGDLKYNNQSAVSPYQCAGKDDGNSSAKFTCSGHFQTTNCETPGDCGLKGIYRGLQIDNGYDFGEWTAVFTPLSPNGTTQGEHVKIDQLDPAGGPAKLEIEGTVVCDSKCSNASTIEGAKFTLTATTGQIYKGICGYTDQVQAETEGLMWAMSNQGVATAPANFDVAMNGTTAKVHTYYKCPEYRSECVFKQP